MGVITETERQKYFAYLDGVADGLNESRNDVNEVLDKIRADVINIADGKQSVKVRSVLRIIDKHRESEE